jgi:hypothetical protein
MAKYNFTYTPNPKFANSKYKNHYAINALDAKIKFKKKEYALTDLLDYITTVLGNSDFELSFDFKNKNLIIKTNDILTAESKDKIKGDAI